MLFWIVQVAFGIGEVCRNNPRYNGGFPVFCSASHMGFKANPSHGMGEGDDCFRKTVATKELTVILEENLWKNRSDIIIAEIILILKYAVASLASIK